MDKMTPMEVLKEIEWIGLNGCVYCVRAPDKGHKDTCIIVSVIQNSEAEIAELRDALYDCYNQFAFDDGNSHPEEQMLSNGGHGTLERVEDILGFSSPIKRVELWHLQGEEYK